MAPTHVRRRHVVLAALCFVLALCVVFIVAYSIATATAVSYIISTDRGWQNRNWEGARAKCAAEGFILASLYSAEDSRLLKAAAISSDENLLGATRTIFGAPPGPITRVRGELASTLGARTNDGIFITLWKLAVAKWQHRRGAISPSLQHHRCGKLRKSMP